MKKFVLLLSIFLTGLAGLAQAQVAAPSLLPVVPTLTTLGFVSDNPAVMIWGLPSRVGGGQFNLKFNSYTSGTDTLVSESEYSGNFLGGRVGGETFAIALEYGSLDLDVGGGVTVEVTQTGLGGAMAFGDLLSVGLSDRQVGTKFTFAGITLSLDTEEQVLGAAFKLGEIFYLGLAVGNSASTSSVGNSLTTGVRKYGAGLLTEGDTQWHLEYYVVKSEYAKSGTLISFKTVSSTLVAEVNFGGLVLGIHSGSSDSTDEGVVPATTDTTDFTRAGIAWMPEEGFGVAYNMGVTEVDDGATRVEAEETAISVYWMF